MGICRSCFVGKSAKGSGLLFQCSVYLSLSLSVCGRVFVGDMVRGGLSKASLSNAQTSITSCRQYSAVFSPLPYFGSSLRLESSNQLPQTFQMCCSLIHIAIPRESHASRVFCLLPFGLVRHGLLSNRYSEATR